MRIGIVGGGIAGLTTALACARRGMDVTVYERAPELGEIGAGIQIGANGMAVMTALGLAEAVRGAGVTPAQVQMRNAAGTLLMQVPMGVEAVRRWGHAPVNLHRADLIAILAVAARAAGARIVTGMAPGCAQASEGILHVGDAVEQFDYVIGADGVRSELRAQVVGLTEPRYTGYAAWRAVVPHRDAGAVTTLTVGADRHLVTYPIRGGTVLNVVAVIKRPEWTGEGWAQEDDADNLRQAFDGWNDTADEVLSNVWSTHLWGLFDHAPLAQWSQGKLILVGDACHPMLPFLAQGASQGLEDAWVLAHTLAESGTPADYEALRKPRATKVQRAARNQGRLDHIGFPLQPLVHLGMRVVGRLAPDFAAGRFDWLYGHDVTSVKSRE